jgi:hypothetical protein
MAPPSYDEAVMAQYIPGQGTVNTVSIAYSYKRWIITCGNLPN